MVQYISPSRNATGRTLWRGISIFVVVIAVLSALWFFLSFGQAEEHEENLGGAQRGEVLQPHPNADPG